MKCLVERNDQLVGIVSENTERGEILAAILILKYDDCAESVNTTNGFKVSRHTS